jgi:predicted transcriptional regulator
VAISAIHMAAHGYPEGVAVSPDMAALLPVFAVGYARAGGLDHPTRIRIYNHLLALPGDHFRSIVRTLSIGIGEGRHHLDVMLRNGLVREAKANGRCRYYPEGQGPALERNDLFAKHWGYRDLRLRVLFAVRNLGDAKPSTVAVALGISRQLAAYHLANLVELGLVTRVGRHYRAT